MDIRKMMQQAKDLQNKMTQAQKVIEDSVFQASAGGIMVSLTLNGRGEMIDLRLSSEAMQEEGDLVADLICTAHRQALAQLAAFKEKEMGSVMPAGMPAGLI
jgi:nucleoid-associated protein EbfC